MNPELLKPEEFDAHLANRTLRLAFIGMSNAGKSRRSSILNKELDFRWYNVDEEIRRALRLDRVEDLPDWLGYPDAAGYRERETQYLALEDSFTKAAAELADGRNLVFDTTGSVAHVSRDTLETLRNNALVVHLDVGDSSLETLIARFFDTPKPIAWSGYFSMPSGVDRESALRHSYPALLAARLQKYRDVAHINLPAESLRALTGPETIRRIRDSLDA